jgi:hypothetical protein
LLKKMPICFVASHLDLFEQPAGRASCAWKGRRFALPFQFRKFRVFRPLRMGTRTPGCAKTVQISHRSFGAKSKTVASAFIVVFASGRDYRPPMPKRFPGF